MWPWGHAAVGYLPYRLLPAAPTAGDGASDAPAGPAVLALGVGTQLPDLVDKPLSWSLALLPAGRTLAHSAPVATVVVAALVAATGRHGSGDADRRRGGGSSIVAGGGRGPSRPVAVAFSVGYASHLLADVPPGVLAGEVAGAGYLPWPVVPAAVYAGEESWAAHFPPEVTAFLLVHPALALVAVAVRLRDGAPGLAALASVVGRRTEPGTGPVGRSAGRRLARPASGDGTVAPRDCVSRPNARRPLDARRPILPPLAPLPPRAAGRRRRPRRLYGTRRDAHAGRGDEVAPARHGAASLHRRRRRVRLAVVRPRRRERRAGAGRDRPVRRAPGPVGRGRARGRCDAGRRRRDRRRRRPRGGRRGGRPHRRDGPVARHAPGEPDRRGDAGRPRPQPLPTERAGRPRPRDRRAPAVARRVPGGVRRPHRRGRDRRRGRGGRRRRRGRAPLADRVPRRRRDARLRDRRGRRRRRPGRRRRGGRVRRRDRRAPLARGRVDARPTRRVARRRRIRPPLRRHGARPPRAVDAPTPHALDPATGERVGSYATAGAGEPGVAEVEDGVVVDRLLDTPDRPAETPVTTLEATPAGTPPTAAERPPTPARAYGVAPDLSGTEWRTELPASPWYGSPPAAAAVACVGSRSGVATALDVRSGETRGRTGSTSRSTCAGRRWRTVSVRSGRRRGWWRSRPIERTAGTGGVSCSRASGSRTPCT